MTNLSCPGTGTGSDSLHVPQAPAEVPRRHVQPLCCQSELGPTGEEGGVPFEHLEDGFRKARGHSKEMH